MSYQETQQTIIQSETAETFVHLLTHPHFSEHNEGSVATDTEFSEEEYAVFGLTYQTIVNELENVSQWGIRPAGNTW